LLFNDQIINDNNNSPEHLVIHLARCNSNDITFGLWKTNDGIDKGGMRLGKEIISVLKEYPTIEKISMVGASLGGLYIRYALKYLYNGTDHMFISNVKPINFITLAAPHLGIDDWVQNTEYRFSYCNLYFLAKKFRKWHLLTPTMKQLLRLDGENNDTNGQCLLHKMANDREYIEPLSKFQNIVNYACILHDKRVSSFSAAILPLKFDIAQYWDYMISNKQNYLFSTIGHEEYENVKQNFYDQTDNKDDSKINNDDNHHQNPNIMEEKTKIETYVEINAIDVKKKSAKNLLFEYEENWYLVLANDVKWKRILVCLNQNYILKKYCHTFLTLPIAINVCKPIFEEFKNHFVW